MSTVNICRDCARYYKITGISWSGDNRIGGKRCIICDDNEQDPIGIIDKNTIDEFLSKMS